MGVVIKDSKLLIMTRLTTVNKRAISFDLPKDFDNSIENEIDYIVKRNKF